LFNLKGHYYMMGALDPLIRLLVVCYRLWRR